MGLEERIEILVESEQLSKKNAEISKNLFKYLEKRFGFIPESEQMGMFFSHLALAIERTSKGEPLGEDSIKEIREEISGRKELVFAQELMDYCKHETGIELPKNEVYFVGAHLKLMLDQKMEKFQLKSTPLPLLNQEITKKMQFDLVDTIGKHLTGSELLMEGDWGVSLEYQQPKRTRIVEKILADFFGGEEAVLVRGAGTGAIRLIIMGLLRPGDKILLHQAPIYKTTQDTLEAFGLELYFADFNNIEEEIKKIPDDIKVVFIQRSRQKLEDSYFLEDILPFFREGFPKAKIVVDENYCVFKVKDLGCKIGGNLSTFSLFKLLGPPGIGCIVGEKSLVDNIREFNYSGGSQVQGPEAMETLRSLVNVPVLLGVQGEVINKLEEKLNNGEVPGVKKAVHGNFEERVLIVQLEEPISKDVCNEAEKLGAIPYPVGSESRYEINCFFYRVAKMIRDEDPILEEYLIRINPMRAGEKTVLEILKKSIERAKEKLKSGGE